MLSRREFLKNFLFFPLLPFEEKKKQQVKLFETYIAGFYYYEGEKVVKRLRKNEPLVLKREPGNPYDENAIEVYTKEGVKLGYIPRSLNPVPAALMDEKKRLTAEVMEVNLPPTPSWERVKIAVYLVNEG
jgi:hypothetical protein